MRICELRLCELNCYSYSNSMQCIEISTSSLSSSNSIVHDLKPTSSMHQRLVFQLLFILVVVVEISICHYDSSFGVIVDALLRQGCLPWINAWNCRSWRLHNVSSRGCCTKCQCKPLKKGILAPSVSSLCQLWMIGNILQQKIFNHSPVKLFVSTTKIFLPDVETWFTRHLYE